MVSNNRALVLIIGIFEKKGLKPWLIEDGLNRLATWYSGRKYKEKRFMVKILAKIRLSKQVHSVEVHSMEVSISIVSNLRLV